MTLSAREGVGFHLVRRARTLTAPYQLRLVVTAFVALLVLDLLRLLLRAASRAGNRDGRELAEVAAEDARLRAEERRLLAAELHDVVTHQLSNVSLQVMSRLQSTDVEQLHGVLRTVDRATDSALTELRLLAKVLRQDPSTSPTSDELKALSHRVAPTGVAASWARQLAAAGFDPVVDVPARADRLGTTAQRTVARALDVACANILRHAPARSICTVSVSVTASQVIVRTVSPLEARHGDNQLGWDLRGLRERVDLTGGEFSAGPSTVGAGPERDASAWVVVVTVPHD